MDSTTQTKFFKWYQEMDRRTKTMVRLEVTRSLGIADASFHSKLMGSRPWIKLEIERILQLFPDQLNQTTNQ